MKNIASKLTAALAAAVMTVSAAGISVCAFDPPAEGTYIGWEHSPNGWTYTFTEFDDEPYREIDGVMYDFDQSDKYVCSGKHSGWTAYNGIKKYRYYHDGLPYTGWTKTKSGKRKYFLDGFPVKEDFQIGDKLYSFGNDSIYTGKSKKLVLTAKCDEKISADADNITLTVTANDPDGGSYSAGEPYKMERWEENGRWVDYQGLAASLDGEKSGYEVSDIALGLAGRESGCERNSAETEFYPLKYYAGKRTDLSLPAGHYRIALTGMNLNGEQKSSYDVYAMFEAVSPVEVKMSEGIYTAEADADIDIQTYITVNSEKLADKDIYLKIEKKTSLGWETAVKELGIDKDASCDSVSADGTITADVSMPPETGYYRAVVTVGEKSYEAAFRVEVI